MLVSKVMMPTMRVQNAAAASESGTLACICRVRMTSAEQVPINQPPALTLVLLLLIWNVRDIYA